MARARRSRSAPCNATEVMLRSGRGRAVSSEEVVERLPMAPRRPSDTTEFFAERVELGLLQVGRHLETLVRLLSPHRTADGELHAAYVEAHDALGDLAATYTWVTLGSRPAAPARPARRRRPWGGRS